ncbi:MAG: class I lanthipeptide [Lewinellaceae bacterium]|jgi:hypothetical protein|nr:class I lanthipeptide [Lewinellaceae bacterium]
MKKESVSNKLAFNKTFIARLNDASTKMIVGGEGEGDTPEGGPKKSDYCGTGICETSSASFISHGCVCIC